ncbi:MAG: hypothetical protein DWI09_08200 [Planctomycetota bacterium]|nr:MAG: hypothetical protein DWI09_08200 [Planctomycetota bacterium]
MTSNPLHWSVLSRATLLVAIATGCFAASAQAQSIVDLQLVGPATPIIPGQIFDVKLRAARQDPTLAASFVAIDCIVGWNPADVKFLSISTTGSTPLSSSYLPTPANDYTGVNEANPPADGNLLYYALTSLGNPRAVPAAGVQVVTFRFESVGLFTSTSISVIDNLTATYPTETIVYDGVVPGVDDFGIGYAATVTQLDCSTIFWYRDSDGDGAGDPSDSTTSCTQPAGYVSSSNDLCPTNAAMLAPTTYYTDADQDGFGAAGSPNTVCQTTAPAGSVTNSTDCNDALVMYNDSDVDGYGTAIKVACNGANLNTDCNDAVAAINPGATEICDLANTDENCNGLADNADSGAADAGKSNFYADADSDTYTVAPATRFCDIVVGYRASVSASIDCNDAIAAINPGATEICDLANTDENCNGLADNADSGAADLGKTNFYADIDNDTYTLASATRFCDIVSSYLASVSASIDCNDNNASINPGATEICDASNVDENCNGFADNADSGAADAGKTNFYADIDNDTYTVAAATRFCDIVSGYLVSVSASIDCNDAVAAINPGATEICDAANTDENCNGLADNADSGAADSGKSNFYADADSDTYTVATATRYCDIVSGYLALVSASIDCNDNNAAINPGVTEICDLANTDENCNGLADNADSGAADLGKSNFYADADSDTYTVATATRYCDIVVGYVASVSAPIDCNDNDAAINPGATEICDAANVDENCNGLADNADATAADAGKTNFYADIDNDTYTLASASRFCDSVTGYRTAASLLTDCDDTNAAVYPGAVENCANDGVDNNCNGEANSDAEAIDSVAYFVDFDADNFGSSVAVAQQSCVAVVGSVLDHTDCNDASAAVYPGAVENCANNGVDNNCDGSNLESDAIDRTTYYADTDGDGAGDASTATLSCTQAAGYVTVAGDTCTNDANKLAPGGCGCGTPDTDANADGNPDCYGQIAALTLAADQTYYAAGEQVLVRVNMGVSGTGLRAADLSIVFDSSRLELVSAAPVAGSAFSLAGAQTIDNNSVPGTLRFNVQVPSANPANTAAVGLANLVFNVRAGAGFCATSSLVTFGTVGGLASSLTTTTTVPMVPQVSALGSISLLAQAPAISGTPADFSGASDAGTVLGAFIAAPTVVATDFCGSALPLVTLVTYPDASTASAWPASGMFPVGVTTIKWTTTDALNQVTSITRTVTVSDYQLLDLTVNLFGSISQNSTRTVRIKIGAISQLHEVVTVAGVGTVTGIQVPVVGSIPCLLAKDILHSVSNAASTSVVGVRYAASVVLTQGDSNDDDLIDILDFGNFLGDRGADLTRRGRSNFNSDLAVNNGDFSFISLRFLLTGDTCGAFDAPGQPLSRISVRELRRRGLGNMTKADFNRDGWVDTTDMTIYMQGGR